MSSNKSDEKKSNPRRKRFGITIRGKRHRRENLDLRSMPYYKAIILPEFNEPLGFDVEFVSDLKTGNLLPAWVALTTARNGQRGYLRDSCVFQAKIYHNIDKVDRMEKYSGVDRRMLATGLPLETVKKKLEFFFQNYKIVGASMDKDLAAFGFEKYRNKCVDVQRDEGFFRGKCNQPIDLKTLASVFLKRRIQSFNEGQTNGHSPIIDSRITVQLYKKRVKNEIESETDSEGEKNFQFCRQKLPEGLKEIAIEEKEFQKIRRKKRKDFLRRKAKEGKINEERMDKNNSISHETTLN